MDNLDKLMEKMENIKNLPVKTEYRGTDLESKLDNLTNQLKNAFDTKSEIVWENGKPEKFSKSSFSCCLILSLLPPFRQVQGLPGGHQVRDDPGRAAQLPPGVLHLCSLSPGTRGQLLLCGRQELLRGSQGGDT